MRMLVLTLTGLCAVGLLGAAPAQTTSAIKWVKIPGGSFMMGSQTGDAEVGEESDEVPVHRVVIKPFQMAQSEVTVRQYKACVDAKACTPPDKGNHCNWGVIGREDHPVNCVDWLQAKTFSEWVGGRLPSEAEWEYAARSAGKDQEYPWGNEEATCERAVMPRDGQDGCGKDSTWPVCSKPKGNTAQGLCDMAGNIREWTQDWWHDSYEGAPTDGSARENPSGESLQARVNRGGDWQRVGVMADFRLSPYLRSSHRNRDHYTYRFSDLGFRPVRADRLRAAAESFQ